jgi:DNA-binding MarR family transcriptional regulator
MTGPRSSPDSVKAMGGIDDVQPTIGRAEMLIDGSDLTFRGLIHGLLTFFSLHQAIRDSYAAHVGLGGVQYTILQSVRHLGSRQNVNIRDVAEHLRLSGSFITIEIKKLEQLGLIQKKSDNVDRRRVFLKVTKKGAAMLNDLAPMQRTVNDVQFANFSRQEFLWFVRLVEQLIGSSQAALTLLHYLKGSGSHALVGQSAELRSVPRSLPSDKKKRPLAQKRRSPAHKRANKI